MLTRRSAGHIELPPGSVVDEYEIDHRLGAGAMGEVYAARHLKLDKRVAIKAISPRLSEDTAAVERFMQEARTLAQMRHPGLVDVLGFGELADGRSYFVMEYLSGESLFDRLARGRLDRNDAFDIFGQMARALEGAHTHNVVHRDLKPENAFLVRVTNEQRPVVKLLDFGLARLSAEADRRVERTQSGVVIGTAMYLSPEQARGPDVDGRTDIYALGCIAYELFLGLHPFRDVRTVAALIAAHLHDVPPIPRAIDPSIPPELDLLLFAMLAKDPAHRPTLPQIRSVLEGVRAPMTPHSIAPRPTPTNIRGTVAVAAGAMTLGICVGMVILGSGTPPAQSSLARLTSHTPDASANPNFERDASIADVQVALQVDAPVAADGGLVPQDALVEGNNAADPTPTDTEATEAFVRPPSATGFLHLLPPSGAEVLIDGAAPAGPLSRLPLLPGRHKIQFVLGSNRDSFVVVIQPSATTTLDKRTLYRQEPILDRNRTLNPFAKKPTAP